MGDAAPVSTAAQRSWSGGSKTEDDMAPASSRANSRTGLVGPKEAVDHDNDKTESKPPKFVYRAEVDGLRFWAVMPVIFYHYNAMFGVTGGYAGVDVFFVISGYLITSIVIRELCSGKPVLGTFWERRVRRLFPAIATMFVCFYVYGWYMLAPVVYNNFVGESIYGLIAGSNIYYYVTTKDAGGYNTAGPEQYPLLHFWSLAVEEQFYMVLPVMLVCIWKYCKGGKRRWYTVVFALGFVFLASFVFSVVYTPINYPFCFYMLFSRAWELAIGSFVGLGTSNKGVAVMSKIMKRCLGVDPSDGRALLSPLQKRIVLECVSWFGFGLILFVYFYYTHEMESEYPYYYALGPCAGAAMVIIGNTPRYCEEEMPHDGGGCGGCGDVESKAPTDKAVLRKRRILTTSGWFLSLHPFVWIGKLSYALYLWHWPIWCFKTENLNQSEYISSFMLILLALALSAFSTECIEQPFRSSQRVGKRTLWSVSCVCWSALMAFSISVYVLNVGGANNAIEAGGSGSALNNATSLPFFPAPATGFEPESFFMENADPKYFSIEGIEAKGGIYPSFENQVNEHVYFCPSLGKYYAFPFGIKPSESGLSSEEIGFDCPLWEDRNLGTHRIFYNKARDPPCIVAMGNSHMASHRWTMGDLAREYDVSVMFLLKPACARLPCEEASFQRYSFESPPTLWDTYRTDKLKEYRPERVVFLPTQLYEDGEELESLPLTFDALLSGDPEKVLIMGDNPFFKLFGRDIPGGKWFEREIRSAIQEGRMTGWEDLNRIEPVQFQERLMNEERVAKAINDTPKYRDVLDFQTIYPAFMDANNTFIQLIGVETEGGNRLLFRDGTHLSQDGSNRLTEYFREHIFKDLNCTK